MRHFAKKIVCDTDCQGDKFADNLAYYHTDNYADCDQVIMQISMQTINYAAFHTDNYTDNYANFHADSYADNHAYYHTDNYANIHTDNYENQSWGLSQR